MNAHSTKFWADQNMGSVTEDTWADQPSNNYYNKYGKTVHLYNYSFNNLQIIAWWFTITKQIRTSSLSKTWSW